MRVLAFDMTERDMNRMYVISQFMRKVKFCRSGCWLWQAGTDKDGYGKWQVVGTRNKRMAHRFAYEWFVGPIESGLQLDHLCEIVNCVNPDHLEPVTPQENVARQHERDELCAF